MKIGVSSYSFSKYIRNEKASYIDICNHAKEMGFCLDVPTGRLTELPSLKLNPADIKGSVGAGDAFCAGSLYGIYHQYDDEKLLSFASAVAATSLFEANATDGIRPWDEVLEIAKKYQR